MGKRDETERRLWELFLRLKEEGEPFGPSSFAKRAGVSRAYLYRFHELVAAISEYAMQTQPRVSRRGAGVKVGEAKKKDVDDRVRRECARLAKEVPALRQELEETKQALERCRVERGELQSQRERLRRLVELLLMLASEAGVSPAELEKIKKQAATWSYTP